jgi:hypothetical protein
MQNEAKVFVFIFLTAEEVIMLFDVEMLRGNLKFLFNFRKRSAFE